MCARQSSAAGAEGPRKTTLLVPWVAAEAHLTMPEIPMIRPVRASLPTAAMPRAMPPRRAATGVKDKVVMVDAAPAAVVMM